MTLSDEHILQKFLDKNSHVCGRKILQLMTEDEKTYLKSRFQDLNGNETFKEIILRIKFKVEEVPKCKVCGKRVKFLGKSNMLFSQHCSCKCAQLDKEVKEKQKKTCLEKYGVEHNFQIAEEQKKSHSKEAIEKCFMTQKKNQTLNSSNEEDEAFEILKHIYKDLERHHKDAFYPFNCDFYVPSEKLYIECQFSMFHNMKPFLGTKEHLEEVKKFQEKSRRIKENSKVKKTRYDALIETWTLRDPKKRECAKKNNLNFKEFWNLNEVKIFAKEKTSHKNSFKI